MVSSLLTSWKFYMVLVQLCCIYLKLVKVIAIIMQIMCNKMQAYAAFKFADACLCGLRGDADIIRCAYVDSQVHKPCFT